MSLPLNEGLQAGGWVNCEKASVDNNRNGRTTTSERFNIDFPPAARRSGSVHWIDCTTHELPFFFNCTVTVSSGGVWGPSGNVYCVERWQTTVAESPVICGSPVGRRSICTV